MATLELSSTVRALESKRVQIHKELLQLDKAIVALRELPGAQSVQNGKRTLSAAARRKIAAAQKARWAKFKQAQKAKG